MCTFQEPCPVLFKYIDLFSSQQKLYTSNKHVHFQYVNVTGKKVSEQDNKMLSAEISLGEMSLALFQMSNEKTPGCDGIPAEVYKVFWSKIGHWLLDVIKESINNGILFRSARKGILTLIPKKQKDPMYVKKMEAIDSDEC